MRLLATQASFARRQIASRASASAAFFALLAAFAAVAFAVRSLIYEKKLN